MASKVIKGLTVEIGGDTTKLGKALDKVETKTRDLSRELGEVNKLLRMDPGNADLLAQKQQILAEAVENTKEKLDTLKEAERQVQEQFERGEVSAEQVRALQREIAATEQKLKGYERAADETADEVARLGDNAHDAAGDVDDVADAADDAEKYVEDLGSSLGGALAGGFAAVTAAAAAATAAIVGCVEASHEYRTAMGKLDAAFTTNGHSAETAYNTYAELQGVLGESDQAVEAANHLAVLVDNEEDLAKWTDICTGVFASYGDSLPIEGLTEAANHTAKLGEVQGPLADALEWSGISAEDFNKALEDCNDEQERQELITETLIDLYGDAADAYKDTNKEVIETNKANEEWNKTVADIGETMAPVVTEIKNFGAEVLSELQEPLKDVAAFISRQVLPAIKNLGGWVKQNLPGISAVIAGLTATMVLYKAAMISSELATKGLTIATIAQQAAQAALNLIMNANPILLVATAVVALATALGALYLATKENVGPVDVLTEEEKKLQAAATEAAQAFRDQKAATDEALANTTAEMTNTQNLAKELQGLADASGKVKEKDQERANFILNELNNALDTEYKMVDGVIQNYDTLKTSIDEVIQSKLANSLLEASNEMYVKAIQNEGKAWDNVTLAEKEYLAQKEQTTQKEAELTAERDRLNEQMENALLSGNAIYTSIIQSQIDKLDEEINAHRQFLTDKETAYNDALETYNGYHNAILDYEDAQAAALSGNYDKTVDILAKQGGEQSRYTGIVEDETAKQLDALEKAAVDAGLAAAQEKESFEKGLSGFTEESVKEAEEGYEAALEAYQNAYADAYLVGEDLGEGLSVGMEDKRSSLVTKAKSLVSGIISAMRKEADSHSPSRKMINFGEDMGEGTEIGLENRTKSLLATAKKQVDNLMGAYADAGDDVSQTAFQNVSRTGARRESQAFTALAGNADKLDKILAAIERGQVLTIDGKQLVGHTAGMYDNELGRRRALAARGAL